MIGKRAWIAVGLWRDKVAYNTMTAAKLFAHICLLMVKRFNPVQRLKKAVPAELGTDLAGTLVRSMTGGTP